MEVLKEYKGYQIIRRYNKLYIRFYGGREEEMPCEIPISEEKYSLVLQSNEMIDEYVKEFKTQIVWTAESFYEIGITEFLINELNFDKEDAIKIYTRLNTHKELLNEIYYCIMKENLQEQMEIDKYISEKLCELDEKE